ncbi:MAG TPA: 6-phosphofructokinase, partial [Planctomycetota bacterium]|nr:6-phosphofructokinase [Planctomycetota bacterium]
AIVSAAREIGWNVAVIGVPKTIDNDIPGIERSFGFETAVQESVRAITSGHIEAHDFPWGVAVIRLMGRDSGFIAAAATVASGDVNFCLVPEVDFDLDGEGGLFDLLERRLRHRGHAVIVVAEGAGKRLLPPEGDRDIGLFLRDAVRQGLRARGIEPSMKYIDPSYMIRSVPANADDSVFCQELAAGAVHAAMSGRTSMMVGYAGGFIVHLPLHKPAEPRRLLDPEGPLWRAVLESTGQPKRIGRARHDV